MKLYGFYHGVQENNATYSVLLLPVRPSTVSGSGTLLCECNAPVEPMRFSSVYCVYIVVDCRH